MAADSEELVGHWRVERMNELLLPRGLRKHIGLRAGSTRLGPFPLGRFRVRGRTLDYALWPVRDELMPVAGGEWLGHGLVFGREFCRFRLIRSARRRILDASSDCQVCGVVLPSLTPACYFRPRRAAVGSGDRQPDTAQFAHVGHDVVTRRKRHVDH